MLQDRISLPFSAQSLRKSRTTILPINFFWTYNFLFHFDDSLSFKTKGARNNCSFCRFQVFISLKKCSFFYHLYTFEHPCGIWEFSTNFVVLVHYYFTWKCQGDRQKCGFCFFVWSAVPIVQKFVPHVCCF